MGVRISLPVLNLIMIMKEYIQKSIEELFYKVSWPSWDELQNDSIVVAIASVIIALIIYLMDASWSSLLGAFYSMF
jgi:preprotein translocase subunit SecE